MRLGDPVELAGRTGVVVGIEGNIVTLRNGCNQLVRVHVDPAPTREPDSRAVAGPPKDKARQPGRDKGA